MSREQQKPSEPGPGRLVDVAQALRDVARSLEAEPDLEHVLEAIVASVPGAEQAGASHYERKVLQTVASTSDLTNRINTIEHELDEGPCGARLGWPLDDRGPEPTPLRKRPSFSGCSVFGATCRRWLVSSAMCG
jgi:hypothetical protein